MKRFSVSNIWIALTVAVAVLLLILAYSNQKAPVKAVAKPSPSPTSSTGPGKDTAQHAGPTKDSAIPVSSPTTTNPSPPVTGNLAKPIGPGNNVSTVSLSSSTAMESTCRADSGTSCHIESAMAAQKVVLTPNRTLPDDGSGGVIFDWDAKQLSAGTWMVVAVITKGAQTAVSDAQTLTVTK